MPLVFHNGGRRVNREFVEFLDGPGYMAWEAVEWRGIAMIRSFAQSWQDGKKRRGGGGNFV
jgi:hypothetical protein